MVGEALAEKSGQQDQTAQILELQAQIKALQDKAASSSAAKALTKLKALAATVPDNAQGGGMVAVIENGVVKNLSLSSKADLNAVIDRAEKGELEVLGS